MTADPILKARMPVDEFLVWVEGRPGPYELLDGKAIAMAPERARHALVKFAAQSALHAAIGRAGLACRMFPDGMTVRIDAARAYEPDALVYRGPRLDPDAVEIPNPIILLEVLSSTMRAVDLGSKLADYVGLLSVGHSLILDPVGRRVIHHRRGAGISSRRGSSATAPSPSIPPA